MWTGQFAEKACSHLPLINPEVQPSAEVCEECVAQGDTWPALRMCLICGYVGCCSRSKNQHSIKHSEATGHPLMTPYKEAPHNWIWCYTDKALLDPR
jgi:CPA2 family monovalent cation:H+ antiporter-2